MINNMKTIIRLFIETVFMVLPFVTTAQERIINPEWFKHLLGKTLDEMDSTVFKNDSIKWSYEGNHCWFSNLARYTIRQGDHEGEYTLFYEKNSNTPKGKATLTKITYLPKEKENIDTQDNPYINNSPQMTQKERDSIEATYAEHRKLLLTPPYLAYWVGASFFTKENIEKDCDVRPVAYHGGAVMYSFPLCGVTMEFEDTHHVCVELSFRLFGKMGYDMKKELIEYGYKLQSQSKDLIAENNFSDLTEGRRSVYKCKLDHGGYSTCIILEGQAMMFTFYRTKD